MAFDVRFEFFDIAETVTTRTYGNTSATVAAVLTQAAVIAPLFDAVIMGGLNKIVLTNIDTSDAFVALADSNVDKNASIKVQGDNLRNYDFDLPMIKQALVLPGRAIDTADAGLVALFAEFAVGKTWRIDRFNPTGILKVIDGTLDK